MLEIVLPIKLVTPNTQEHWRTRYTRNQKNKLMIKNRWLSQPLRPTPPCLVTVERIYSGKAKPMDARDNLRFAFKSITDTIAELLVPGLAAGQADDEKYGIRWEYKQTRGTINSIRITIE